METATVPQPSEPVTPPPTETQPEPIEAPVSIADHAEQFGPSREPANTGQFANKPADARHKAASQRATPEDVAEINRLTKELRETERRLGEKDPDATSSPRVRALKRQIAALKALEAPAPEPPKAPEKAPEPVKAQSQPTSGTFDEKEPTYADFEGDPAKYPDPYAAYIKATARYEARKERWEAAQHEQAARQEAEYRETVVAHTDRVKAFASKTPDFNTVTAELMDRVFPAILLQAVIKHDRGPEFMYYLGQHPELADELVLMTDGKPVTDAYVATVQRRLSTALGQAAHQPDRPPAAPPFIPPKPPNPVRTGPIKTADDPPGEAASIAEHAKYYGKR